MPTYEYKCPDGHTYSEVRSISAPEIEKDCDECGKPLRKIFNAPPITFKGGGWGKDRL